MVEKLIYAGRKLKQDLFSLRFALLGIAAYFLFVHFAFGQFCPMLIFLHFPCPGCGMTRALFLALTGCWAAAWQLQPLVFGWIALGIWFVVERYFLETPGVHSVKTCAFRQRKVFLKVFLVLLLAGTLALYVWRVIHGFPAELVS